MACHWTSAERHFCHHVLAFVFFFEDFAHRWAEDAWLTVLIMRAMKYIVDLVPPWIVLLKIEWFNLQDAKKDEAVRKAYKHLAALHEVR